MSTTLPPLVFRCDAGFALGTGHVMRCLALAQGWQDIGGEVVFVMRELPAALWERLRAEGIQVVQFGGDGDEQDVMATAAIIRECRPGWVVADGYHLTHEWQRSVRAAGCRLLAFDDHGQIGRHCADLVVDQNLGTSTDLYADCSADTRLLLGPRYVLLRREFRRWQERRGKFSPVARRILVTLGGADSRNATAKVLRALDWIRRQELETVALVGPANPHRAELETLIRQSRAIIDLRQSVQDVPEWMAWADVAIAAGGTTTWELLFMGVPSLLLILADNQASVARSARAAGFARCLGRAEDVGEGELA
ncbi:MAG TPA: UDP-2,4-diacetamido-2,4,6-trideoxy-beta-L-altropyranose hydrolase, partial [Gemmataceae bacterium]|nr:UDP-2,4-diacetamido-2,4,6-trideoxy-beta-L-altropyranose hydrolase [Gemmataceae bacterium]